MLEEPQHKTAIAFIDGQNLFRSAQDAFDIEYPDFDPTLLSLAVCRKVGWNLHGIKFYTGVPPANRDPFWHGFWSRKLAQMGKQGVKVFSRPLQYRRREIEFGHGGSIDAEFAVEKGIDVRIAIDVIRCCLKKECDVALVFSQDQDLSEIADEIRGIASERGHWIKMASAFPVSPKRAPSGCRGINKTDWIEIDQALYDSCRDRRDYRPRRK